MWFSKPSILIIDDDTSVSFLAEKRLSLHDDLNVDKAHAGESGLSMALAKNYDLIILDWMMPEMNGMEVLKHLKMDDRTKDTPVLMLTGKKLVGEIEDAFANGATDYLTKPFELTQLSEKVKNLLA